jgi:Ca-activated chloride channel homolog
VGRHRNPDLADGPPEYDPDWQRPQRRRRGRIIAVIAFAGALAVLLALGVTGYFLLGTDASCWGRDKHLGVAVTPEMAPAIDSLATEFEAGEECLEVAVEAKESSDVAYGLTSAGPTTGGSEAQVWIADSSLWATHVQQNAGAEAVEVTGTSLATSPLVLASPDEQEDETSWASLVPDAAPRAEGTVAVHVLEPTLSSSGLSSLALIYRALQSLAEQQAAAAQPGATDEGAAEEGDEDGDATDEDPLETEDAQNSPEFIATLQTLQKHVAASPETAVENLKESAEDGPAFVALSEQAVWRHNEDNPDSAVHVSYPSEGTYSLDYPLLFKDLDGTTQELAEQFRDHVRTDAAQAEIRSYGFRSSEGVADDSLVVEDYGFQQDGPSPLPSPTDESLADLEDAWKQLRLGTRMLTVYDISGSMLAEVPGTGANRMEITLAAAQAGLELFEDDAEIGVWEFATELDGDLGHREVMPVRRLDAEVEGDLHRDLLFAHMAEIQPDPHGDTALYETILAGYREMQENYAPDRSNVLQIFTDGEQDNPDGDLTLDGLLESLEQERDPDRPIPVIIINFGADLDTDPMQQVAEVTGGASYETANPEEIGQIFLEAFTLRLSAAAEATDLDELESEEDEEN